MLATNECKFVGTIHKKKVNGGYKAMEKLIEILEELVPGEEFEGRSNLVTDGVLDSFAILSLISEISYEMGVDIPVSDVVPENFDSVDAIMAVIEKHRK